MASNYSDKYREGNLGGRPPMFDNPEQLEKRCVEYFEFCDKEKGKATITGLTLFLGFADRCSLIEYSKKDGFTHIIKRAKTMIENSYEEHGQTIDIFALKNMGWKDKQEIEQTTRVIKVKTS
jgi:hypothetical protein